LVSRITHHSSPVAPNTRVTRTSSFFATVRQTPFTSRYASVRYPAHSTHTASPTGGNSRARPDSSCEFSLSSEFIPAATDRDSGRTRCIGVTSFLLESQPAVNSHYCELDTERDFWLNRFAWDILQIIYNLFTTAGLNHVKLCSI